MLTFLKTLSQAPRVYPLTYSAYRHPSFLFFGEEIILSAEGVQQGDPLGPLLFCLGIHNLDSALRSAFCVFYLNDGILGGSVTSIKEDLSFLKCHSSRLGLSLNQSKSEIIGINTGTQWMRCCKIFQTFAALMQMTLLFWDHWEHSVH
jgi:hypothetical protein